MNRAFPNEMWNRFWHSEENPRMLAALRILWGLVLIQKWTGCYGLFRLPDVRFLIPRYEFQSESSYPIQPDGFSPSYPLLDWIPQPSFEIYRSLEGFLLIASCFFVLGLFFRIIGPLTAVAIGYLFFSSPSFYHHHTFQMVLVTSILGFTHCARAWSLDAILFRGSRPKKFPTLMPRRMIQVLVALIYFFTSISKMNEGWLSGRMIELLEETGSLRGPFTPWILEHFSYQALGMMTVFTEFFLWFGLWIPKVRNVAIMAGIGLHIGIDMMMAVGTFSYQMIALYPSFLWVPNGDRQGREETESVDQPANVATDSLRNSFANLG